MLWLGDPRYFAGVVRPHGHAQHARQLAAIVKQEILSDRFVIKYAGWA